MYPIITESLSVRVTETMVPMRDGVRLYTRIAVPQGQEKCPVVLIRTPYEDAHGGVPHPIKKSEQDMFVRRGYAVVTQHCRGHGDSEGICIPYNEKDDGLCTLEYIRTLPCFDHEIYLYGGSYLSTVHLSYLSERPADVKGAALSIQTDRMYFRNYRGGCNYAFNNFKWWLRMLNRQYPDAKMAEVPMRPYKDLMKNTVGEDVAAYTAGLMHTEYDDYWRGYPQDDVIERMDIPVLFTEGWYDFYIDGMFGMWERLPAEVKRKSAFVVGPWGHATAVKNVPYNLPNGNIPADFAVEWFDSIREQQPYRYAETGKVNYYSIGADMWQAGTFPTAAQPAKRMYFGRGTLEAAPADAAPVTYIYDPEAGTKKYFPSGNLCAAGEDMPAGIVRFISGEVSAETNVFGRLRWHMDVSSDCEDTAFYIRVYFVENGTAYYLTETIAALRYVCEEYVPGERVTLDLETPPIAFTLKPGMRLRADIASSGGPYVPHANVRGHWAEVTETRIARNTLYPAGAWLELPLQKNEMQ